MHSTNLPVMKMQAGDQLQMMQILSRDVPDDQFLRELTHNGIEAVGRLEHSTGSVQWDYCRSTISGHAKLRVWDTGVGMSSQELLERVNILAARARTGANYGVGGKISLYRVSPHGVVYYTLQDGVAVTGRIGLQDDDWGALPLGVDASGQPIYVRNLTPTESARFLPSKIRKAGHGTAVVLLGLSDDEDTVRTLQPGTRESNAHWVLRYLNERYETLPDGVLLRAVARNGKRLDATHYADDPRTVYGGAHYLSYYSRGKGAKAGDGAKGKVTVTVNGMTAEVRWWLLDSNADVPSFIRLGGRVRTVVNGEVYDDAPSLLTKAGIYAKQRRVELHIMPAPELGVTANLQRTGVTVNGASLPMEEWCQEFRRKMPDPIKRMLEDVQLDTSVSFGNSRRFAKLFGAFARVDVLSARGQRRGGRTAGIAFAGAPASADRTVAAASRSRGSGAGTSNEPSPSPRPATAASAALTVTGSGRLRTSKVTLKLTPPAVCWVDANVEGDTDLQPFAARFDRTSNVLTINTEHETYQKLLTHWLVQYRGVPGAEARIVKALKDAYSWRLTDQICGVLMTHPDEAELQEQYLAPMMLTAGMYAYSQQQAEIASAVKAKLGDELVADALAS